MLPACSSEHLASLTLSRPRSRTSLQTSSTTSGTRLCHPSSGIPNDTVEHFKAKLQPWTCWACGTENVVQDPAVCHRCCRTHGHEALGNYYLAPGREVPGVADRAPAMHPGRTRTSGDSDKPSARQGQASRGKRFSGR